MVDAVIAAVRAAIAARGLKLNEADLEAIRAAIERVWAPAVPSDAPVSEGLRDAWAALRLVRWALEQVVPPGALPSDEATGVRATEEAEALCKAIFALANTRSGIGTDA